MATIGVLSIGLELAKSKFDTGVASVQTSLGRSATACLGLAKDLQTLTQAADRAASRLESYGAGWSTAGRALGLATTAAGATGNAVVKVALACETTRLAIEAMTVGCTLGAGALRVLGAAASVLIAPFVAVARAIKGFVSAVMSVVSAVASLFTPFGRFLAMLKLYIFVGRTVIAVTRGAAFAARMLTHALNPIKLAGDLAALGLWATAKAAKLVVKSVGPIKSVLGAGLRGVASAAVLAGVALVGMAGSAAGAVDQAGDAADRIGTTTAALQSLRYAATLTGSSNDALDQSLEKLNVNLGKAAIDGGPVADALKRIGLDARALATIDPTEAFTAIAAGMSTIQTPAERAAIAMTLFGKGGTAVLTTLQAGPAEIRRLSDEFKSLGGAVSESQRQSVGAMFDAFDRVKAAIQGVGAQIAVKLAPDVVALGDHFVRFAAAGGGFGSAIETALKGVGVVVEHVGHAIDLARLGWYGFKSNGLSALAAVARAVATVGETLAGIINLIPGMRVTMGSTARAMGDELDRMATEAHQHGQRLLASQGFGERFKSAFAAMGEGSAEARAGLDDATKAALRLGDASVVNAGKIEEIVAKLREEKATFGLTSAESEVYKLKQLGAADATIAEARAISTEIRAMEDRKKQLEKDKEDAKKLVDEARTPYRKLRDELARIQELKSQGLLTDDQARSASSKVRRDAGGGDAPKFAAALEFGSKEARTAVLAHQTRARDPMDDVARTGREHLSVARKTAGTLERIAGALTGGLAPAVQTAAI